MMLLLPRTLASILLPSSVVIGSDAEIQRAIERDVSRWRVLQRIGFIPDEETELYFKAADVLVLPYTRVYQSGVIVLGYTFGLPVIAADVGSLREEIVEGKTGFLCKPGDSIALNAVS